MIIVCPLHAARQQAELHGAKSAISLLGPDMDSPVLAGVAPARHLSLTFHDVAMARDGLVSPQRADAERLVQFIQGWTQNAPLLIHCWAGISRSTAAAFVALCVLNPEADENALAAALRKASPTATPNRLIVTLADELLTRDGRMLKAVAQIGRGEDAFEGNIFTLPARLRV